MNTKYSLVHLSDQSLQHGLHASAARHRAVTAEMLAFLAEFDERRLYLPAGYESMYAYCLGALHMSGDAALKRTQAARIAREFPAIFAAIEDGRLHLSAVVLLAPHLRKLTEVQTPGRCGELLEAAAHKTSEGIRQLLAAWFPREDQPAMPVLGVGEHAPEHVANADSQPVTAPATAFVGEGSAPQRAPEHVNAVDTWARVTPVSAERYELRGRIDRATLELLQQNQSLLSHAVPSGNLAEVLRRALSESVRQLEKRKFRSRGAARRAPHRGVVSSRHISKHVRDAVWQRDGGQCAYVGEDGHRCGSRTRLEFDHMVPVAQGGKSTVDNVRLLCDPHNQFEADRALGAEFMRHKREGGDGRVARDTREPAPAQVGTRFEMGDAGAGDAGAGDAEAGDTEAGDTEAGDTEAGDTVGPLPEPAPAQVEPAEATGPLDTPDPAPAHARAPVPSGAGATPGPTDWIAEARARLASAGLPEPREPDVVSVLRRLGMRADRARELAKVCDTIPEAPLEQRVRVALSFHGSSLAKPVRRPEVAA